MSPIFIHIHGLIEGTVALGRLVERHYDSYRGCQIYIAQQKFFRKVRKAIVNHS